MDLIRLAQILLRHWWLVVVFSVAGMCCAYALAINAPKRYQSTVSLQLNPAARSSFLPYGADANIAGTSSVVAQAASYNELLRSRSFGQVIVQQLNLPLAPESIAGSITTQLVPNTNIMRLSVTWDNPADAQLLAQRIADIFIAENQRRQQALPGNQTHLADMEQSAREIQSRLGPLQQQRDRLDESVARGDLSRLNELTGVETRLSALQSSYANLLIEVSRVRASFDTAVVLDTATPGQSLDTMPLTQALLFGLLAGLGAAVGLLLLAERVADVVRGPSDVVAVAGTPPLGRIGHARTWRLRGTPRDSKLIMLRQPASRVAEDFRTLRANLRMTLTPGSPRTLLVTSTAANEGKTFVAANLAMTFALSGERVLLVDADLRRPTLHTWFGVPRSPGLVDALRQAPAGQPLPTAVENLWLLPAGEAIPNPGDVLASEAVARLFGLLLDKFDLLVLDSAPVSPAADALLLAAHASASIIVARGGRTRRAGLRQTLAALGRIGRPVAGVVITDDRAGPLARLTNDDYQAEYVSIAHAANGSAHTTVNPTPRTRQSRPSRPTTRDA